MSVLTLVSPSDSTTSVATPGQRIGWTVFAELTQLRDAPSNRARCTPPECLTSHYDYARGCPVLGRRRVKIRKVDPSGWVLVEIVIPPGTKCARRYEPVNMVLGHLCGLGLVTVGWVKEQYITAAFADPTSDPRPPEPRRRARSAPLPTTRRSPGRRARSAG
jgi:hypothetical protein